MPTRSCANDASTERCAFARRVAVLGALAITGTAAACSDCRPDSQAVRDSRLATHDTGSLPDSPQDTGPDSDLARDGGDAVHDGGPRDGPDAGRPRVIDAGSQAGSVCPPWRTRPASGHGWLHIRALTSTGVPLTTDANHVDIYVRGVNDPIPGARADPNDPCAVASFEQSTAKVRVLAAALGFSSQEREFTPQRCVETSPCSLTLPPSLNARYYRVQRDRVSVRSAGDLPERERSQFAVDLARDALARSKNLGKPLAQELEQAAKATSVPAVDLAIRYSESKLGKRCDARCLDEPKLDLAVRQYLKAVRRRQENPFDLRTSPDKWRTRIR